MNLKSLLFAVLSAASLLAQAADPATSTPSAPRTLTAFASEEELNTLFARWQAEAKKRQAEQRRQMVAKSAQMADSAPMAAPAPAAAKAEAAGSVAESVTNTQTAGVDEGGIVKLHGKHLVVLRRGRLFTVQLDTLKPVAAIDAFGPGVEPGGAWYDEMLISGDTIAVIGYSYARGGTEVGLFDINARGELHNRATYHLRSNDYYSSRNYASRLIGSKLVFYTPLYLNPHAPDPYAFFPAYRRWHGKEAGSEFRRIAPATRIYRADDDLDPWGGLALHTVTVCDLAQPEMACEATAVMGPAGRVFYVSAGSVYVWTTSWRRVPREGERKPGSALFRIPLDGGAPQAIKAEGSPIDQFSFLEADGHLNVLLRANGRGEAMWAAEGGSGEMALLRLPLDAFGDGRQAAVPGAYRALPKPAGHTSQNRYVGKYLLYGSGASWGRARTGSDSALFALRYAEAGEAQTLALTHGVDRIEALGANALVVGGSGPDLHFSAIRLAPNGKGASVASRYVRADAAQGETRSHGFFYKPENADNGLLGLPVRGGGEPGHRQLRHESAAVLFLRNSELKLSEIGALESQPNSGNNDGCRASCVDWYGNSRPLFIGKRVIALMGYELVEGALEGKGANTRIVELRRSNFAPRGAMMAR
jgi:hypothetical protein